MPDPIDAELVLDFGKAFPGEAVIAYGFVEHGEPVFLTAPPAFAEVPFARDVGKSGGSFARSQTATPYEATVRSPGPPFTSLEGLTIAHPMVQRLPEGEILIVGSRCYPDERNGCIFSRDGRLVRRLQFGDGIESVQATGTGEIWVSYCDEGVFGNYGWGGGKEPIGSSGLVCFDREGNVVWRFSSPGRGIVDCYVLNVAQDAVWAYYYTDFPLARIGHDRTVREWSTPVQGARALAVSDDFVLLYGSYSDRDQCWLGRLGEGRAKEIGIRRVIGDGAELHAQFSMGRGPWLHLVANGRWWRVDARAAEEA